MKIKAVLYFLLLLNSAFLENMDYQIAKDEKSGKFKLVFNEIKTNKDKSSKKLKAHKKKSTKRKLKAIKPPPRKAQFGALIGGAAAGAVVGTVLGASSGVTKQIEALRPQVRNLQLKNSLEKENNSMLFQANMNLRKIYGDLSTMRDSFVFLLEQKKNMLVEILPDVSV